MKKLPIIFLLAFLLLCAASCEKAPIPTETLPVETEERPAGSAPVSALPKPDEHTFQALGSDRLDLFFPCSAHDLLTTQKDKSISDFENTCKVYEQAGYALYSSSDFGGTVAKTYVKDAALAHLYYHPSVKELNVVVSDNLGGGLPPVSSSEAEGSGECTVIQLNQMNHGSGGMGYVIRLKDGSFLIYDGGLTPSADEILEILKEYCPEGTPRVRAWILTHFHNDHYEAFFEMARRIRKEPLFTVDYVIASPIVEGYQDFLASFSRAFYAFEGARFIFAHTGMKFTFGEVVLEFLYTPESLYKTGTPVENFNNTSMLTRLRSGDFSMLFTGDLALEGASLCETLYGDTLASDWCQMSHHGLEDCPLSFYERVKASVYWVPTTPAVYAEERNLALRRAVESLPTTKEILVAGTERYARAFGS